MLGTDVMRDENRLTAHDSGLMARLSRFRRDEEGSLLIFGLFCFVCMLFLAGVALDLMRFEDRRTVLQNTVDRAILAAADLDQKDNCNDVIKDYFKKAGLAPPKNSDIKCNQGNLGEWRTAQACSIEQMPTWFMKAWNIKTMQAPACGTAEERAGNVEISLVLDVSGSMDSNNRLINLKPAAKDFIDQMFDTVEDGHLSINLITYSTQAALGPDLYKYFYTTGEHNLSTCIDFATSDYSSTAVPVKSTPVGDPPAMGEVPLKLTGYFEPFNTTLNTSTSFNESSWLTECPSDSKEPWRATMAFSGDRSALKNRIDSLIASGNTSIDIGMKWGTALLDPGMNGVVRALNAEGKVDNDFTNRPYSFADNEVLKVVVLMTDGANTTEYRLKTTFDGNGADNTIDPTFRRLWVNSSASYSGVSDLRKYSYYDSSRSGNKYFRFYDNTWQSQPWGYNQSDISGTDYTTQMEWPDVWKVMSVNYFADNIICKAYGTNSSGGYSSSACKAERDNWRTSASTPVTVLKNGSTTKDTRTLAVCDAAKAQDVMVFTIGFEAPTGGLNLLKSCATSPAHFYSVAGLNIDTAFKSIAQSINKLRLTH